MDESVLVDNLTLEWLIHEGQRKIDEAAEVVKRDRQQAEEIVRMLELARGLLPKAVRPFLYFHKHVDHATIIMRLNVPGLAMMEVHFWGQWEDQYLRIGITSLKFSRDPFKVMDYEITKDSEANIRERYFVDLRTMLVESDLSIALAHAARIGNRYDEVYAKAQELTREEMDGEPVVPRVINFDPPIGELLVGNIQDIVMQVLLDEGVL